ncbi:DUF7694 domain-containing protein [Rossellomorea vietnamensis]|uniref:DUF7694 domain-containing protein n=1 Tax=Rossellomorea vietnamensis TaxID=218284 RepID=UPI00054D257F|nr:hypothetical protein [Rossellomorea vietnamensis]
MKNLNHLNEFRVSFMGDLGDDFNGAFILKIKGETYQVIASNGGGWEHVSISHKRKIPSWKTMCELKDLFFEEDEAVMQLHPAKSKHINNHNNCLHLWRPVIETIPLPPTEMVGIK